MSVVELRVELPSYSHSFIIQVPQTYTIAEVKGEITKTCVGAPRADGQRVIWRGRVLRDDEKVDEIWKSTEDSRIVHLAVNPSAWSSTPPELPSATAAAAAAGAGQPDPFVSYIDNYLARTGSAATQQRLHSPQPSSTPSHTPRNDRWTDSYPQFPQLPQPYTAPSPTPQIPQHPMGFVIMKHQSAMMALTTGRILKEQDPLFRADMAAARPAAIYVVERNGYQWPSILDEEFAGVDSEGVMHVTLEEGVKYERSTVNGQQVLKLQNEGAMPNIMQVHALKVLSYTLPLLFLPAYQQPQVPLPATTSHQALPREVNQLLQQLGLPPIRVQNQAREQRGIIREIPLRPLIAPFVMLIVRTLLLVYFVSPARKPVFGIVVGAWILYEAWGPIRAAIFGPAERHAAAAAAAAGGGAAGGAQRPQENEVAARPGALEQNGAAAQPRGAQVGAVAGPRVPGDRGAAARHVNQADAVFENLANINISTEADALASTERARPAQEPGLVHKLITFVMLFVLTLHPAIWNRRRVVLRQREGRLRTEANAREREPDVNTEEAEVPDSERTERERVARVRAELLAQHERRPRWVRAYVDRVRQGEWVEE